MSIDGWRSVVEPGAARWSRLERGWKSTIVAGTVVALVSTLKIQIPW
ncbi:hypothetical protein [Natrinema sp. 1APR25-10V2]|nr:hypothetical protein [Natrinema sp. 1APR25-10V2]MDS0474633.1 hypothetical protein [Natrinema sp. 1APR25-10V2]